MRIKSNSLIFENPLSAVINGISKIKQVEAIIASGNLIGYSRFNFMVCSFNFIFHSI
jgi:hypothetical protein